MNDQRPNQQIIDEKAFTPNPEATGENVGLKPNEGPLVIACSYTPSTPQPVRTRQRYGERTVVGSVDSWASNNTVASPTETLNDVPYTISELGENERCTSPVSMIRTPSRIPNNIAEPAHFLAPPKKTVQCTCPTLSNRYDRNVAIPQITENWVFKPLETFSIHETSLPNSWTMHVQPEGQHYFLNASHAFVYVTEAHLYDPRYLAEAELFIREMEMKKERFERESSERVLPTNVEVCLEIEQDGWYYYMVDLDRRCLFWLDDYDASWMADMLSGIGDHHQLRHYFDHEFWTHIERFPQHRQVLPGVLEELMGIILHGSIDTMTSLDSTAPYSAAQMRDFSGLVKYLHSLKKSGQATGYIVAASARLMAIFTNERFFHFHGYNGARLTRDQSVRGSGKSKRSWLIKILSPALFFAPATHLTGLEKIWIDNVIKAHPWKQFVEKLERDWEQFILYSTVLLNANVAFLAIPSVLSDQGPTLWASPAQVASQVSIIASMGSIILGLLLVRQHRTSAKESSNDAANFLLMRTHPQLGLETLAIMYSLPYALLMWGMASFLTSIAIVCFFNVDGTEGMFQRAIYTSAWICVVVFILWTILTGWETKTGLNWRGLIPFYGRKREDEDKEISDAMSRISTSTSRTWRTRVARSLPKRRFTWGKEDRSASSSMLDGK